MPTPNAFTFIAVIFIGFLIVGFLGFVAFSARKNLAASAVNLAELKKRYQSFADADMAAEQILADAKLEAAAIVKAANVDSIKIIENAKSETEKAGQVVAKAKLDAAVIVDAAKTESLMISDGIKKESEKIDALRLSYAEKKAVYDRLLHEVAIFDEKLAFADMGVYEPHFDFTDSEQFKVAIEKNRTQQKLMISNKSAAVCKREWTVDGSRAKGKTMTGRGIRLTLRAFNSECDAAIANVRWNNANAMVKRVGYARDQIDKLNESNVIVITDAYYKLKLDELMLTHEYREKQKQEREDRAEAARASREEQKLAREVEDAEREESKYQKLLDKARKEAQGAQGEKLEAYSQRVEMLERELAAAHEKAERAQAMAEMTRSGYVYIISNIGSFGENMVKIGLTRRLDPTDRVRELGDASVPFLFDTHAIIYSDDAPALERALHNEFAPQRVNATNMRKEFFRVSLEDVESAVKRLAPDASFFRDVEAQEYRETLSLRNAQLSAQAGSGVYEIPASI